MLKAKLDSVRKNKKGFSLVELIIVIAIMVALIAVMAPAFVKYVAKARASALASAAEDYASVCKTIIADPDESFATAATTSDKIVIKVDGGKISVTADPASNSFAALLKAKADAMSGADNTKKMGDTTCQWTISFDISVNPKAPIVKLIQTHS